MKKVLFIALLAAITSRAMAQPGYVYSYEYKNVVIPELMQAQYDEDPEADAAVIFEKGTYQFIKFQKGKSTGLQLTMTVDTKIKIYNEEGIKYGIIEIPYYNSTYESEFVTVKGATYNLEGGQIKRHKLKKSDISAEAMYDDFEVIKIRFPEMRAGSVIEFRCIIKTLMPENMRPWRFSKDIPVMHSRLVYRSTPVYSYKLVADPETKFDRYQTIEGVSEHALDTYRYREKINTYEINKLPAFNGSDRNGDSRKDYLDFQLVDYRNIMDEAPRRIAKNEAEVSKYLLQDPYFGKFMESAQKEGASIVAQLGLTGKTDIEKLEMIAAYVSSRFKWNGRECKRAYNKFGNFVKGGEGNSAEINLFMTGLLKAAGMDANPLVLTDRPGRATYEDYPFSLFTDSVIAVVRIGDSCYYADAVSHTPVSNTNPAEKPDTKGLVVSAEQ